MVPPLDQGTSSVNKLTSESSNDVRTDIPSDIANPVVNHVPKVFSDDPNNENFRKTEVLISKGVVKTLVIDGVECTQIGVQTDKIEEGNKIVINLDDLAESDSKCCFELQIYEKHGSKCGHDTKNKFIGKLYLSYTSAEGIALRNKASEIEEITQIAEIRKEYAADEKEIIDIYSKDKNKSLMESETETETSSIEDEISPIPQTKTVRYVYPRFIVVPPDKIQTKSESDASTGTDFHDECEKILRELSKVNTHISNEQEKCSPYYRHVDAYSMAIIEDGIEDLLFTPSEKDLYNLDFIQDRTR